MGAIQNTSKYALVGPNGDLIDPGSKLDNIAEKVLAEWVERNQISITAGLARTTTVKVQAKKEKTVVEEVTADPVEAAPAPVPRIKPYSTENPMGYGVKGGHHAAKKHIIRQMDMDVLKRLLTAEEARDKPRPTVIEEISNRLIDIASGEIRAPMGVD